MEWSIQHPFRNNRLMTNLLTMLCSLWQGICRYVHACPFSLQSHVTILTYRHHLLERNRKHVAISYRSKSDSSALDFNVC